MADPGTAKARVGRVRGGLVTFATVIGLLAAMGLTLFGLGSADHAVATYDASSWLWSSARGEVARVNGGTGRVDTRVRVPDGQGHRMQVSQTDRHLLLRDVSTGRVSALDLATLQTTATTPTTAGLGVTVALRGDAAFIVDAVQGIVRQLDPRTLVPIGEPVRFPPGITGGSFDGAGRLWVAVPGEGTVAGVTPAPLPAATAAGGAGGGLSPRQISTLAVAAPSHDLVISALDDGVAVFDRTTNTLTTIRGGRQRSVPVALSGAGALPPRTNGADVPVTVVDDRHVYVVTAQAVRDFTVPGDSPRLRPAVAWAGRFYCVDDATGTVYVLGLDGRLAGTIPIRGAGGGIELDVREGYLFINAPHSASARVVDTEHRVRVVDKYADGILGGDPPPPAPPKPPERPRVGPPSAPRIVTAAAGNARVRVSWRPAEPNGSAILRYVVAGGGTTRQVGAAQRSVEITGLTNGTTYRFTVHAVNAKGAGPKRTSNPVVPTSDVPAAPARVTAADHPDGTVTVSWSAANGLGRRVVRYQVTAVSAGTSAPVGDATGTSLTIKAGDLEYGTQVAFTVVAVNDRGAGSTASPPSNTVVPYTVPGPPADLAATTVADRKGSIRVSWSGAEERGRPITGYVVDVAGARQTVTGTAVTLTGFGDGQDVTARVHAVNAAGDGEPGTATARTISPPQVTVTAAGAPSYTEVSVAFTVNDGGSPTTLACTVSINGAPPVGFGCRGGPLPGQQWPGNRYAYAVTVTNAAGSVSFTGAQNTPALYGQVVCTVPTYCGSQSPNGEGIWVYSEPTQAPPPGRAVNDVFAPARYQATCWRTDVDGLSINATPWGGKRSTVWIRIRYSGDNYIPYAWLRLDAGETGGGAPTAILPPC